MVADALSRPPTSLELADRLSNADHATQRLDPLLDVAATDFAFETVDHKKLALDQKSCPKTAATKAGKHAKGLIPKEVKFSPGVTLLCDVSFNKKIRPIVPADHRQPIMRMFHQLSHPGVKETTRKIADRYYWQAMKADISKFVTSCHPCISAKSHKIIKPPMNPRPVTRGRFKDIQVDIVGPLPPSQGYRYLLTIVDRTTR